MTWLSDEVIRHLRDVADTPHFAATRYEIRREIARGGMGVVYEAFDRELLRTVAVKVLAVEYSGEDAVERMRREARIVAQLEHPGIVPVHDVGTLPDGRLYYAMKLVRGETLTVWLGTARSQPERLRLFLRVCEAVAFAHARGYVHRDLKPDNIMVGELGDVLVMDWGVAGSAGEAEERIVGTIGYMSPEQKNGVAASPQADVFSLGVILREMCEPAMSRPIGAVVARATDPLPGHRYHSALELSRELSRSLDGLALETYRETPLERLARWTSNNRALVTIVAAYLVMRIVMLLVMGR